MGTLYAVPWPEVWLLTEPGFATWLPRREHELWNGPGWTIRQLAEAWEARLEQVHHALL